ncbi:MAG: T9SS type A sorting domain-containing protein [Sporocytophaga sp.]|uniref:T9SS type A sorting domain-containing protein n=1 Tax=Sporocytophaga sp. TaxID=2231183 RepID=UPI001B051F08|nr:T9SS type A sorting domain-containing protein [Sporocytophaga sp.]MBO9703559.1 T9SS type A sorting domain-containing protein [Sporocytophaga sp.]
MKLIIKAVAVCNMLICTANAQENVFKPTKEAVYFRANEEWKLSSLYHYTYNQNGDQVTKVTKNGSEVPMSKDSLVYSTNKENIEHYYYIWDPSSQKWNPSSKETYCYNENGESCGHASYIYSNGWVLDFATEDVRSFPQADEEEVKTRVYGSDGKQWKDMTKYLIKYDAERKIVSKTYSFVDPVTKAWTYSSRISYNGWLDFENDVPAKRVTEEYKNNEWLPQDSSTFEEFQNLWIETRKTFNADKSLKEILKISNSKDGNYRDVMKAWNNGWLQISSYDRTDIKVTTTHNEFEDDQLLLNEKTIYDIEKGQVVHSIYISTIGSGEVIEYSEAEHELVYDDKDNLLEDIASIRTESTASYTQFRKTVYSDFVEIGVVAGIENKGNEESIIYPNPGTGIFNIRNLKAGDQMIISNASGVKVFESAALKDNMDLSNLTSGIYLVKIINNETVISDKLVIE